MDDVHLDDDTYAWLVWKAQALTQGNVGKVVAHYLRLAKLEEEERRRLGLGEEQALPETSWTALEIERAQRAEP